MRLLLAAILSLLLPPALAGAASAEDVARRECFLSTTWQGWSTASEGDALYLRMQNGDVFRVDLTEGSRVHRRPGEFLVNEVRGSSWICSAIDLDLEISDDMGFSRPVFPVEMRKLTEAEVTALSAEDRPN